MRRWCFALRLAVASASLLIAVVPFSRALAQEQTAASDAATVDTSAPAPLTEEELEVLVARIALYPDELIAVISGASLYPLQIVEAERYLEQYAKDKSLKPKESWDGSVVSLLNYPDIVKMMSDDLDWTQQFGDALAYQQKDVLIAIQQLRDEAVAKGIIKSDDKIKVIEENDNVVIQSASTEKVYVPRYEPQMLYEPGYAVAPISYYPEPYPSYWYPTATFFAAAVTGAAWAAVVDWDDWGVWGGRWGNDVDVDCNGCFNNRDFNGKVNFNDVDWKNVDRSKINIDRNQIGKFDRTNVRNSIERNNANNIRNRASSIRSERPAGAGGRAGNVKDVRKSTLEGLKNKPALDRPNAGNVKRPDVNRPQVSKTNLNRDIKKPSNVKRPSGKAKPAARVDNRPKKPSGLGNVGSGKKQKMASKRGNHAMGGGARAPQVAGPRGGGGRHMAGPRGGGGRHMARGGGGHRGGGGRRR